MAGQVEPRIGMPVMVDLAGLSAPGIQIGGGVQASGTIIALDRAAGTITVKLNVSFSGMDTVTVSPGRVTAESS